jgi:hypothetical protein
MAHRRYLYHAAARINFMCIVVVFINSIKHAILANFSNQPCNKIIFYKTITAIGVRIADATQCVPLVIQGQPTHVQRYFKYLLHVFLMEVLCWIL